MGFACTVCIYLYVWMKTLGMGWCSKTTQLNLSLFVLSPQVQPKEGFLLPSAERVAHKVSGAEQGTRLPTNEAQGRAVPTGLLQALQQCALQAADETRSGRARLAGGRTPFCGVTSSACARIQTSKASHSGVMASVLGYRLSKACSKRNSALWRDDFCARIHS